MVHCIYYGHSFVELEFDNKSILIDPFISGNPFCKLKLEDFYKKNIQAIIITHGHQDHIGDCVTISQRNDDFLLITTFEVAQYFKNQKGITNIHAMHIGGEYDFVDYKVKFVNAVHGGMIEDMHEIYYSHPAGVVVRINGKNIHHAGDTGLTYDMKLLGDYDKIDVSFLPIGGNFTMDEDDAVIATSFIKPKIVVPIHYDTWPSIKANAFDFAKKIMQNNYAIPKVLDPGQFVIV